VPVVILNQICHVILVVVRAVGGFAFTVIKRKLRGDYHDSEVPSQCFQWRG
jgi:hypothetical protein